MLPTQLLDSNQWPMSLRSATARCATQLSPEFWRVILLAYGVYNVVANGHDEQTKPKNAINFDDLSYANRGAAILAQIKKLGKLYRTPKEPDVELHSETSIEKLIADLTIKSIIVFNETNRITVADHLGEAADDDMDVPYCTIIDIAKAGKYSLAEWVWCLCQLPQGDLDIIMAWLDSFQCVKKALPR